MYVSIRKYESRKTDGNKYYFYLCESKRINGKIENKQYKFSDVSEKDIFIDSDDLLKTKIIGRLDILITKHNLKISNELKQKLWNELQTKLEELRQEIVKKCPWYQNAYNNRNNKNSYYNSFNDFDFEEAFRRLSRNNKNSYYTKEEKTLFKEMYKEMAKIFHPDSSKDDGRKMQLLNKIKNQILD